MTTASPVSVEITSYGNGGINIHIRPHPDTTTIELAEIQGTLRTIADNLKETTR